MVSCFREFVKSQLRSFLLSVCPSQSLFETHTSRSSCLRPGHLFYSKGIRLCPRCLHSRYSSSISASLNSLTDTPHRTTQLRKMNKLTSAAKISSQPPPPYIPTWLDKRHGHGCFPGGDDTNEYATPHGTSPELELFEVQDRVLPQWFNRLKAEVPISMPHPTPTLRK